MTRRDELGGRPGERCEVLAIGPLPPPVHGASLATQAMVDALSARAGISVADLAPSSLTRSPKYHAQRLAALARASRLVFRHRKSATSAYMALAGGRGLYYNVLLLILLRACGYPVWLHHHSFSYIVRRRFSMWVLTRIGGPCVHICLCGRMAAELTRLYGAAKTLVLSNATLVACPSPDSARPARTTLTLGLLSNLHPDKGLVDVIELHRRLRADGVDCRLVLAGPAASPESSRLISSYLDEAAGGASHVGPVYGAAKHSLFASLDLFVFPTRYEHEAEPLVVLEALASGVPVIAYGRGCIGDMVGEGGYVIPPEASFVEEATRFIETSILSGDRAAASRAAVGEYERLRTRSSAALDRVIADIAQGTRGP